MTLTDEILKLYLQVLKSYPEFNLNKRGTDALRRHLQINLDRALRVATVRDNLKQLRSAIILSSPQPSTLGLENVFCQMYFKKIDSDIQKWVIEIFDEWNSLIDDKFILTLDPNYKNLLPYLVQQGLCIQSLLLHGFPEKSLQLLGGPPDQKQIEKQYGLRIESLSSIEQADCLVEQRRRYFETHPQHSPINSNRKIDNEQQAQIDSFVRDELIRSIQTKSNTQFVILHENEIAGGFGLNINENHPYLGSCAGVDIFLEPSLHGRGVGTLAYRFLLNRMIELKVQVFHGVTANPAVIHLARKMHRPLRGLDLVPGNSSEIPDHFKYEIY